MHVFHSRRLLAVMAHRPLGASSIGHLMLEACSEGGEKDLLAALGALA